MKALHEDSTTKIEAVLNDTQKQKFEALQAQQREHMQERMQGGGQQAQPQ
jgi:protein CpxP